MDGIDAVLVDFSDKHTKLIATHTHPIPKPLQRQLTSIIHPAWQGPLSTIGALHQKLGKLFAEASNTLLKSSNVQAHQVYAIGSHGQTVWHQPDGSTPFSLQLGDANQIAELTGITTVADFRSRDIAAHGQGAPLVPAFHQRLFKQADKNCIVLNLGGIANITLLPQNGSVSGFDTGPGNGLLDAWILKHRNEAYDKHGTWAKSGNIQEELLNTLTKDPYFTLPPPKSTGKEYFNLKWLENSLGQGLSEANPEDIQATLVELTATSISDSINTSTLDQQKEWNSLYVCGGGIHNQFLIKRLQHHLPTFCIESTEKFGVSPDWMEAIAFAWLAKQTLDGEPGNLTAVTGAKGPRVLGAIYHK